MSAAAPTKQITRGSLFFWIVQTLLLPAFVCFAVTCIMRFSYRSQVLWQLGLALALVQIPFTALAFVFNLAASLGELLPKARIRIMFLEIAAAVAMIAAVFLWRGVYRVF